MVAGAQSVRRIVCSKLLALMWIETRTRHDVRLPSLPQQLFTPFVNHLLRRLPADDQSRKFQIAAPTNTDPVGTGMGHVEPAISVVILVVAQAPQYHCEIPTPKRGGGGTTPNARRDPHRALLEFYGRCRNRAVSLLVALDFNRSRELVAAFNRKYGHQWSPR